MSFSPLYVLFGGWERWGSDQRPSDFTYPNWGSDEAETKRGRALKTGECNIETFRLVRLLPF